MFDKVKISDSYFGLVGVQNPTDPKYAIIDSANQESRSGRFVTENPYAKVNYFLDCIDNVEADDLEVNETIANLQKKSISDVLDSVLFEGDYIDRQMLYQFPNNKIETDTLPLDSFVGIRIKKSLDKNIAFKISRIILEFEGSGDIELLLFNSAKKEPVYSKTITISSSLHIEELGWVINDTEGYFQGEWYLGYLSTTSLMPIKRNYENANIQSCITHLGTDNISAPSIINELFDLTKIEGDSRCWGLNPDFCVYNDFTDLMMQQQSLFAPAIQLQFAINWIEYYIASSRSNNNAILSTDQIGLIIGQIEGIEGRIVGYKPTLLGMLTKLKLEVERMQKGMFATGFKINYMS